MVSFVMKCIQSRRKVYTLPSTLQLKFLKRLHRLLRRGYALTEALKVLSWDEQMVSIVEVLEEALYEGRYFDEALDRAGFHELIVVYIYFVRINGDLLTGISQGIEMFEQRINSLEQFKKVSRYPIFLFTLFILLTLLIKQFILPSYKELFQYHTESKASIELTFFLFNSFFTFLFIVICLIILLFLVWIFYKRKLSIEKQLEFSSHIPIYRKYIMLQTSFYFATHMSLLLKTGMSMKHIMEHLKTQNELPIVQYYASIMMKHLEKGYQLKDLLQTLPYIDQHLANLFQENHEIDTLQKDLATYADFVSEYMKDKMMRAIMYVQPVTFTLLGLFIIIIYFSLLWPMFQLIDSI